MIAKWKVLIKLQVLQALVVIIKFQLWQKIQLILHGIDLTISSTVAEVETSTPDSYSSSANIIGEVKRTGGQTLSLLFSGEMRMVPILVIGIIIILLVLLV